MRKNVFLKKLTVVYRQDRLQTSLIHFLSNQEIIFGSWTNNSFTLFFLFKFFNNLIIYKE